MHFVVLHLKSDKCISGTAEPWACTGSVSLGVLRVEKGRDNKTEPSAISETHEWRVQFCEHNAAVSQVQCNPSNMSKNTNE